MAPSGLPLENPFNFTLIDYIGQTVSSDNSSVATVEVEAGQGAKVSKNTKVKSLNGIYAFKDFIVTSEPNNTIWLVFTSTAINAKIL